MEDKVEEDFKITAIQIVVREEEEEEEEIIYVSDSEDDEKEETLSKKKKKKTRDPQNVAAITILTKTLAQALRLINEQRERERKKQREIEIRRLALEQKKRMESNQANNSVRIRI